MRSFAAVAFALAFLLAGCADLVGRTPTVVERCQASQVLLFREDSAIGNRSQPIPQSQSYATLLNRGVWTRATFNISPQNGTGNWGAPLRVLHNITIEEVKLEFQRGVTSTNEHDVNVSYGVRRTLSESEYATFCGTLANSYSSVPQKDEGTTCGAIGTTAVWRVWLDGREMDRSAYCGGASNATREFIVALDAVKSNDAR